MIDKEYLWKYFVLGVDHQKIDGAVLWQYRDINQRDADDLLRPYMIYKIMKRGALNESLARNYVNFILNSMCDGMNISTPLYIDCRMFYDSLPSVSLESKSAIMINFSFYAYKKNGYKIN